MNKHKIISVTLLALITTLILALSISGQSSKYRGNAEAKRLTRNLPVVDKVELMKLEKKGDLWTGQIEASKVIEGREAENLAKLWRQQDYEPDSASCHLPAYAVKFYSRGKLLTYATLCWDCNNIGFEEPDLKRTQGFNGTGSLGQKLLQVFKDTFPEK